MERNAVYIAYIRSFLWIALLIAIAPGIWLIVESLFVDFVHGNPNRPQSDALLMMALYPPTFGLVAFVGSFLVFALPQCLQALVANVLVRRLGRRGQFGLVLALPLIAVLTWY